MSCEKPRFKRGRSYAGIDYSSAKHMPVIFNNVPIGIVEEYRENGMITCTLWDMLPQVKVAMSIGCTVSDNNEPLKIDSIVIERPLNMSEVLGDIKP